MIEQKKRTFQWKTIFMYSNKKIIQKLFFLLLLISYISYRKKKIFFCKKKINVKKKGCDESIKKKERDIIYLIHSSSYFTLRI